MGNSQLKDAIKSMEIKEAALHSENDSLKCYIDKLENESSTKNNLEEEFERLTADLNSKARSIEALKEMEISLNTELENERSNFNEQIENFKIELANKGNSIILFQTQINE